MNYNRLLLIIMLLTTLAFPYPGSSQGPVTDDLLFGVHKVYPPVSVTLEKLNEAKTILDLNEKYKSSWVREYISVEIQTIKNGKTKKAVSKSDVLTQEQKDLMKMADLDKAISVKVLYMPDNTLKHNDIQEIVFSVLVTPAHDAQYVGGTQQLNKYLKEKAIHKIPSGSFQNFDLAAVKFTISEQGQIVDAHIFLNAKDEKTDALLLDAICSMPGWKPASYADGTPVKQEFVLTVGSMKNCQIYTLNIGHDLGAADN
jgi:hypothetical protein